MLRGFKRICRFLYGKTYVSVLRNVQVRYTGDFRAKEDTEELT